MLRRMAGAKRRRPPLGVARPPFGSAELPGPPDGTLVFYTDGLVESAQADIKTGPGRLARLRQDHKSESPEQMYDNLATALLRTSSQTARRRQSRRAEITGQERAGTREPPHHDGRAFKVGHVAFELLEPGARV
jgi:hypothetical protein